MIQHNLDWVWPYWVQRQFDPQDGSFVPRAFSITHINLTHRNWTAVGLPDLDALPVVDPAGLVTPRYDGWSLDAWLMADDGRMLVPSRIKDPDQCLDLSNGPVVTTETGSGGLYLTTRADVADGRDTGEGPACRYRVRAQADGGGWLALALRPYNPEGIFAGPPDRAERRPPRLARRPWAAGAVSTGRPSGTMPATTSPATCSST